MLTKIKYELFKQRHIREIFLLYLIVLSLLFLTIYTSLAFLEKNQQVNNVAIVTGGALNIKLTSSTNTYNKETGVITVGAKTKRIFNLTVENITKTDIKYKLYYEIVSPKPLPDNVNIGILNNEEAILEKKGEKNTSQIGIINNSNEEIKLKIWYKLGYGHNELVLEENKQLFTKLDNLLSYRILADNDFNIEKPDFTELAITDEGMFRDEDKDGDTYYFRGISTNNYVKIDGLKYNDTRTEYSLNNKVYSKEEDVLAECDKYEELKYESYEECKKSIIDRSYIKDDDILFRIVRINGDNTIRLISDKDLLFSKFNDSTYDEKYIGYTYDNSKANIQDGTPSTIKTEIDTWYINTMKNYDSIIATTRYCNDTSVISSDGNENIIYSGKDRIDKKLPSFICPETDKTYGGEYNLKAGLISADEVMYAYGAFYTNYGEILWTGTPNSFTNKSLIFNTTNNDNLKSNNVINEYKIKPVINIIETLQYTTGSGTIDDPYIIKIN